MAFADNFSEELLASLVKKGIVDPDTKERIPARVRLGLDVKPEPATEPEPSAKEE